MSDGATVPPAANGLAASLVAILAERVGRLSGGPRPVIGIAGESGSGKTVTALALVAALTARGVTVAVLHQDDYFVRPPRTNHEYRTQDIGAVGPQEVQLDLLASHIAAFREGRHGVEAPRVDYPANRFVTHHLDFADTDVLLVEGTYVLQLDTLDVRIFLEATHEETRQRRRERNRDIDAPVIDKILAIEHHIIAAQRARADVVIDRHFALVPGR